MNKSNAQNSNKMKKSDIQITFLEESIFRWRIFDVNIAVSKEIQSIELYCADKL
jgi:hypothetical protein